MKEAIINEKTKCTRCKNADKYGMFFVFLKFDEILCIECGNTEAHSILSRNIPL
jgi:hypothetical protein|tara:strand:+ start:206 stop:367 length:162 start_codon:yes stop_codon:yes gene_type:complete